MTDERDDTPATVTPNPWQALRGLTPARIALGRAGVSLPTRPQLAFQAAHAQARDAVHLPFDHAAVRAQLHAQGHATLLLHSAAHDRDQYLQRPDLGRRLDAPSAQRLRDHATVHPGGADVALVVADGLSALAVHRHAAPLIACVVDGMRAQGWSMAPIALVEQGRVAVADEVGERLGARMVVILIGERPGLSSPDSLGLYFTYAPRVGLTDAARNCISNVRPEGLGYAAAAHKLLYLMREAWRRQVSGIQLKEAAEVPLVQGGRRNFLLD